MPELSRSRWVVTGHQILPTGKVQHFLVPEGEGSATTTPGAVGAGAPLIVTGQRKGIIPDDSIIETVSRYEIVTVGTPPASAVAATVDATGAPVAGAETVLAS
jgi:hypothetical protein